MKSPGHVCVCVCVRVSDHTQTHAQIHKYNHESMQGYYLMQIFTNSFFVLSWRWANKSMILQKFTYFVERSLPCANVRFWKVGNWISRCCKIFLGPVVELNGGCPNISGTQFRSLPKGTIYQDFRIFGPVNINYSILENSYDWSHTCIYYI